MKCCIITVETILIVILMSALALGGLFYWLSQGPQSSPWVSDLIHKEINRSAAPYEITFSEAVWQWEKPDEPLTLTLHNFRLAVPNLPDEDITIDQIKLSLVKRALLFGQIRPRGLILQNPTLHLSHIQNEAFLINDAEDESGILPFDIAKALDEWLGIGMQDSVRELPDILSHFRRFEIRNAHMTLENHYSADPFEMKAAYLILHRQNKRAYINLSFQQPIKDSENDSAYRMKVTYDPDNRVFDFNSNIDNFSTTSVSPFMGALLKNHTINGAGNFSMEGQLDNHFTPLNAEMIFDLEQGSYTPPSDENWSLNLGPSHLALKYTAHSNAITLLPSKINVNGSILNSEGKIEFLSEKLQKLQSVALQTTVDTISLDTIREFVPKPAHEEDKAQEWIHQRLIKADFKDVNAALDMGFDDAGEAKINTMDITFAYENLDVNYKNPFEPLYAGKGTGHMTHKNLEINLEHGKIFDLDTNNAKVVMTELFEKGAGFATITGNITGPLNSVFRFVSGEPLNIQEKLDFDVNTVKGKANVNVKIAFPAIKDVAKELVKVSADGTLNDILIPDVLKTLDLTGGPFAITIDDGSFRLNGSGEIAKQAATLNWHQYLSADSEPPYQTKLTGQINIDKEMREIIGIPINKWIEGIIPVTINMTENFSDDMNLDINADLTRPFINIKDFDYIKAAAQPANVTLTAKIKSGNLQSLNKITAKGPDLEIKNGKIHFSNDNEIQSINLQDLNIGPTKINVSAKRAKNHLLAEITGDVLYAAKFLENNDEEEKSDLPPLHLFIDVRTMIGAYDEPIQNAKINLKENNSTPKRITLFEMDGKVANDKTLYVRYKPSIERSTGAYDFHMESGNAGATLRALGLFKDMHNGELYISGESNPGAESPHMRGHADIVKFKVMNTPVLARLLSAMSLTGILDLLSNDGVNFAKLSSKFEWIPKDAESIIVLKDGRTSGSSLGLTFEGKIDRTEQIFDMSGTIVPISDMNNFVSKIPLLGEIIAGGKDSALFAATYKITGPLSDPKVSVNPLSVLAPGFIRHLLFEE